MKPVQQQPPQVPVMIVADEVLIDPATSKTYILGAYSTIIAGQFPCSHQTLRVYVELTDGRGRTPITVRLVDTDQEQILFQTTKEVDLSDPTKVCRAVFHIDGIVFPASGEYRLQLWGAGELLGERRILLASRTVSRKQFDSTRTMS